MKSKRNKPIYGNCRVHHPDGRLMFSCSEKRAKWYLNRNLATILIENPLTIILNFEPKGMGNSNEYYLCDKDNACVVCAEKNMEVLTKHHVVPLEYRKNFPLEKKSRSSHDIVIMCEKHHFEYENLYADKLKEKLEKQFGINRKEIILNKSKSLKTYKFSEIMLDSERCKKIPITRIEYFRKEMKRLFGTDDPFEVSKLNLYKEMDNEINIVAKKVVENVDNIDEFCIMWRKHFVEFAKPKYLPIGWDVEHIVLTKNIP